MMEFYRYYFILYLIDMTGNMTFISNTDPVTYTLDINCAKLYETEVNVDNDILDLYDRISILVKETGLRGFIKAKIRKALSTDEIKIEWIEEVI